MALISLAIALAIEQFRPLDVRRYVVTPLASWARFLDSRLDDGQAAHAVIAWIAGVVVPSVVCGLLYIALYRIDPALAFIANVAILYLTIGFRHSSHFFTDIHIALRAGEIDRARSLVREWRGRDADRASSEEVARLAIEEALIASHRQVFGVMIWFLVLPGPTGAVAYRLAEFFAGEWGRNRGATTTSFGSFARRAFEIVDWLPVRITAGAFAVVGDFEDALSCWQSQAQNWPDRSSAILLASGAGALGVRLGMPVYEGGEILDRPELGLGEEADADFLQSTIGLVWRTLVLELMMVALIGVAGWVGH